jgi:uncharacterized protein (DUF924 family)
MVGPDCACNEAGMDPLSADILGFWFGDTELAGEIARRDIWFRSTPAFDGELVRRYQDIQERASGGAFDHFVAHPADCLALVLLLDQVPRNIYRGTARAFSSDAKAREVAREALDRRYNEQMSVWRRLFLYLPFEHSENLADQDLACALYETLDQERALQSAYDHREAIRRFGRFPHRNAVLGRANTPEEAEYLENPPLWGKTAAEVAEIERRAAARERI